MIDTGQHHDTPSDGSGSHRAEGASGSSAAGSPLSASKIQFSTDPDVVADDQTVVAATPASAGGAVPPKVPTSGDLGKMLEGEKLGHFHLEKFIGGGGMGAVFRGTDEMLGRTVAIKVLSPQQGPDDETTRRFRHEAQSTARLDHDHIARVYYVGVDRGWHYIVLEYVEGENLRDIVAFNGPLSFADVISYTLQISEALGHASSRDVVHRDIKPSNVLITHRKQAKLVDMGLARLHQVDNPEDDLTASGVTLGTFDYISPEQARDPRIADVRSDLYSLGCTVYFMLTGRPPFPQGTVLQKLLQHQGDAPPDPRRFRPDVPDAICRITGKLLAKNPEHRYQVPNELIHELLAVSMQLDLPVATTAIEDWPGPVTTNSAWAGRHLPWAVPVALFTIIVAFAYLRDGLFAETPTLPEFDSRPTSRRDGATIPGLTVTPDETPSTSNSTVALPDPQGDQSESHVEGAASDSDPIAHAENADATSAKVSVSQGAVVVGESVDADYASLADACREVGDSATIELRYNGLALGMESPIVLDNRQLTIRGGEGYSPIVRFLAASDEEQTPHRAMIQVAGGRLTFVNVHLELTVPEDRAATSLSLIEATQAERIDLQKSTITVYDRRGNLRDYDDRPSVFRVSAPSRQGFRPDSVWGTDDEIAIELEDCIVGGDADFLTGDALGSVLLDWHNGLLAVERRFVEMKASEDGSLHRGRLQIHLEHVTAHARRGFVNMSGGDDARYFPLLKLNCVDCILLTAGSPLISQASWHRQSELEEVVRWSGHNNFFAGFDLFWLLEAEYGAVVERLDWVGWQDRWPMGSDSSRQGVMWRTEIATDDALAHHRVDDYTLRTGDNPAIGGATDGMSNVGMVADDLPALAVDDTEDR